MRFTQTLVPLLVVSTHLLWSLAFVDTQGEEVVHSFRLAHLPRMLLDLICLREVIHRRAGSSTAMMMLACTHTYCRQSQVTRTSPPFFNTHSLWIFIPSFLTLPGYGVTAVAYSIPQIDQYEIYPHCSNMRCSLKYSTRRTPTRNLEFGLGLYR